MTRNLLLSVVPRRPYFLGRLAHLFASFRRFRIASIHRRLGGRNPAAISWPISVVIVYAINVISVVRLKTNISKEVFKRILPCLAHLNTSSSVAMVLRVIRITATLLYVMPRCVFLTPNFPAGVSVNWMWSVMTFDKLKRLSSNMSTGRMISFCNGSFLTASTRAFHVSSVAYTLLLALLITPMAVAQGSRYDNFTWTANPLTPGQSANVVTVPRAAIHVCSYPANATPCTNYLSIYSDKTLSTPITQPGFAADDYGNFGFYAVSGCYEYTVTVSGVSSGPYPVCLGIAGGSSASLASLNGMRFADQFANINAAAADCGVSKCIVIIPSTYLGTDCPTPNTNVTFFDYRGNGAVNCIQNDIAYNFDDGNVNSMVKEQMQASSTHVNGSIVSHWFQTYFTNGTAGAGSGIDGVSTEAVTTGTLTGTLAGATGNESPVFIQSTGGTITAANGIQGYITDIAGRTTGITTAIGVDGLGCYNMTGSPKPVNCYGLYGHDQNVNGGQASSRNYSVGLEGRGLLRYSANSGAAGFDAEDHTSAVHSFLYTDDSDNAYLRGIGGNLYLLATDGTTGAYVDPSHVLNVTILKIGASGSPISDSRNLAQFTASLNTTAAASDNVSITGVTAGSHCSLTATNASAATNIATTYISAKTTNQITVAHSATASMTYDILCTAN